MNNKRAKIIVDICMTIFLMLSFVRWGNSNFSFHAAENNNEQLTSFNCGEYVSGPHILSHANCRGTGLDLFSFTFGAISSFIAYVLFDLYKIQRKKKNFLYNSLYIPFNSMRNRFHLTAAYNFSDLSYNQREKVIDLLCFNWSYIKNDQELSDLIYDMLGNYHNTYNAQDDIAHWKNKTNESYNALCEAIINRIKKLENKIYAPHISE